MNWFRLYHSTLESRKVQTLPDREFKAWVNLLIIASKNTPRGQLPSLSDIAFTLRLREDFVTRLISKFTRDGLVDNTSGILTMHDWDEHQFGSDDVNTRVKTYRDRKRNVTRNVTPNDTCINPDSDTDSDTDSLGKTENETSPTGAPEPQKNGKPPAPVPAPASVPEPKNGRLNVGHTGEAKNGSGLTLEKFMAAWNRHHKQNKHESTKIVFQMVLSFNVDWEELEKRHVRYCAYWSKKGWNFCTLSFLQWIENGMLGPPDEKPAEKREPDWVDPYAGIAEAEEEPQPEPQRAPAQPHLITRRRAQ